MNALLEDLAEQCYHRYSEYNIDLDKFAALIVNECANLCLTHNVSNLDVTVIHESSKLKVMDLATVSCGKNLHDIIKKKFGIE